MTVLNIYKNIRRFIAGKGLSKFRVLRNLDYLIRRLIYQPKARVSVRGNEYFLDPRGLVGDFDGFGIKLVEEFVRSGDTFVDVGASFGPYTVLASRSVGRGGRVFAFEPNINNYELLLKNLKANGCSNVVAENMAISDSVGVCTIYTVGDMWLGSSLIDPESNQELYVNRTLSDFENKKIVKSNVKKTTLDAYLGDQRIAYVKTDTEGNEGLVFRGMQRLIKNNPDIIIEMEFMPVVLKRFGTSPGALIDEIKNFGFEIFMCDYEPHRMSWRDIENFSGDIIFTRRKDVIQAIEQLIEKRN